MTSEESKILIQEYAKNPINNYSMQDYTIKQHEGNFVCGDDITIYLHIKDNKIKEYSFDGNCSTVTIASASFLAELITNKDIDEVLTWNYKTLKQSGFEVSRRRENAAIIALLAVQNAILKYKKIDKQLDFEDLL